MEEATASRQAYGIPLLCCTFACAELINVVVRKAVKRGFRIFHTTVPHITYRWHLQFFLEKQRTFIFFADARACRCVFFLLILHATLSYVYDGS